MELSVKVNVRIKGGCWSLDSDMIIPTLPVNTMCLVVSLSIALLSCYVRMLANESWTQMCVYLEMPTPTV